MDAGPIIVQAAVPVLSQDTPDSLAARVLTAEHKAYPLAVRLIAEGRTRVEGMVVQIDPRPGDEAGLLMSPSA
jgi:phosphoribosylglycinamide formyltransferase-1